MNIDELGLGRREKQDNRDRNFPMKAVLPKKITRTSKYWWSNGYWGDQGPLPHCVGYSLVHWLEDAPVTHSGSAPIVDPALVYHEAQQIDEWEGTDYDGTSVRAGAKVLQSLGFITEYRWAFDINTLVEALLTLGPVVVGTNWHENMFTPNDKGLIQVQGRILGGHAYVLNGVNTKTRMIRLKNSWGREWGKAGHAFISFDHMERLIRDDGEACIATESPNKSFKPKL